MPDWLEWNCDAIRRHIVDMTDFSINTKAAKLAATAADNRAQSSIQSTMKLMDTLGFEALEGVPPHPHPRQHVPPRMRLANAARRGRSNGLQQSGKKDGEHDPHLHAASLEALEQLQRGGEAAMDTYLLSQFDVLERHSLLRHAIGISDGKDQEVLERAMDRLLEQHGDAIEVGLGHAAEFQTALHLMDSRAAENGRAHDPGALQQLRAMYGVKGKQEATLTAASLAKVLLEKFGHGNFMQALAGLRSTMAANLRAQGGDLGPRMWLSMSDAASFNAVQSGFAIGRGLRVKLHQAGVMPHGSDAATGVALLGVADKENADIDAFVGNIVAGAGMQTALQQVFTYKHLGDAVALLPASLWPQEKPTHRAVLLDGLTRRAADATSGLVASHDAADSLQRQLQSQVTFKNSDRDK
ncbi:hypothetical protein BCF11_2725 [Collimonas sp. PA-H2]|uniref:hypothetical protein n=1 Tax=Collimonas sp. PA-H2 TaxID=1881062 RepID=UPI000C00ECF1|nr:hypothetical protein [Collimonas sp. PA-H2]PFH10307.1 hypothetical protein BCF11_2725 [Collimonas sp. PA-H2]